MIMNKGWNSEQIATTDELTKYSWAQGHFKSSQDNWDGKTWKRNFHELRCRDLSIFALGIIENKSVLDIGCGTGEYLITMAKMGAKIAGQDIEKKVLKPVRKD